MSNVMLVVARTDRQARGMVDIREMAEADCVIVVNPELTEAHIVKDRYALPGRPVKVVTE